MEKFHFVEEYEKLVDQLLANHPRDEAMSRAVGGGYETFGAIQRDILMHEGLSSGHKVIDVGCGSGRLAWALGRGGLDIEYFGIDIVDALIGYAREKSPAHFRFQNHRALSIPSPPAAADFVCFFIVFTHLLHHESYVYLREALRCLRPGGKIVVSFLEFSEPTHWIVFRDTAQAQLSQTLAHLNSFIERSALAVWASHLDLAPPRFPALAR